MDKLEHLKFKKKHMNIKLQTRQLKRRKSNYAQKNMHECTFFYAQTILCHQNEPDLRNLLNPITALPPSSFPRKIPLRQEMANRFQRSRDMSVGAVVLKFMENYIYKHPEEWYQWKKFLALDLFALSGCCAKTPSRPHVLELSIV